MFRGLEREQIEISSPLKMTIAGQKLKARGFLCACFFLHASPLNSTPTLILSLIFSLFSLSTKIKIRLIYVNYHYSINFKCLNQHLLNLVCTNISPNLTQFSLAVVVYPNNPSKSESFCDIS
jgi:hypothetical protein